MQATKSAALQNGMAIGCGFQPHLLSTRGAAAQLLHARLIAIFGTRLSSRLTSLEFDFEPAQSASTLSLSCAPQVSLIEEVRIQECGTIRSHELLALLHSHQWRRTALEK